MKRNLPKIFLRSFENVPPGYSGSGERSLLFCFSTPVCFHTMSPYGQRDKTSKYCSFTLLGWRHNNGKIYCTSAEKLS